MINHFLRILMIPVFLGAFLGPALAEMPGDNSRETPREGVLVLHGGQVLQGKIVRAGDLYHVILSGGEIRIRATEVAYQSDSLEGAYRHRREMINVGNADEHIGLARWCLRNGLLSATARELADAMAANPNHPWIPHLERSLKAALAPPVSSRQVNDPATKRAKAPTGEELDQMVRRMPPGSVEAFTATVQPLLINSCTSSGCHGLQSNAQFQLLRGRGGRGPSRRMTQRNLHAALQFIDQKQPEKSPLLTEAVRVHGNGAVPLSVKKDSQKYRQIAQWVYQVTVGSRSGETFPEATDSAKPLIEQADQGKRPSVMAAAWPEQTMRAASPNNPGGVTRASHDTPAVESDVPKGRRLPSKQPVVTGPTAQQWPRVVNGNTGLNNMPPARQDRPNVQRGAKIKRFVPVDPFDPEIFNRRYHGKDRQ